MNPYQDLVDSYKSVKWKKNDKWSLYSAKYESRCGEKSSKIAELLSGMHETAIKEWTAFIAFAVFRPRFYTDSFCSTSRNRYSDFYRHPYTFLVALETTVVHLNGKRVILKQGDLLPVMEGSEFICSEGVSFLQ